MTYQDGYENGVRTVSQLPGPILASLLPRLLQVTPDPDDDPVYDAGFRDALWGRLQTLPARNVGPTA